MKKLSKSWFFLPKNLKNDRGLPADKISLICDRDLIRDHENGDSPTFTNKSRAEIAGSDIVLSPKFQIHKQK